MGVCYSAIKPSGMPTLGHYFGTVCRWHDLADAHQCFFSVADLHALTQAPAREALRQCTHHLLAFYLACGFERDNVCLYIQSQVPEHSQLSWLLNCLAHMGELARMTQYKDYAQKFQEMPIGVGLFDYPVLMSADIALFQATHVPVGADQKQHVELARTLIARMNHAWSLSWPLPEPLIDADANRLMGLQYPQKKMSKTDDNSQNVILFSDSAAEIKRKIMRSVTDNLATIRFDPENQPGVSNLLSLLLVLEQTSMPELLQQWQGRGYGDLKKHVVEVVLAKMQPIQAKMNLYLQDRAMLEALAVRDAELAREVASVHLATIHAACGLF